MKIIETKVELYNLLTRDLNERTPKLSISRPLVDLANYMVFEQLQKELYVEDIENFCNSYAPSRCDQHEFYDQFYLALLRSPRNAECAEVSEAVVYLAMEIFNWAYHLNAASVDHGILALIDILPEQYLKRRRKKKSFWIESTAKFEQKYDCQVRLRISEFRSFQSPMHIQRRSRL